MLILNVLLKYYANYSTHQGQKETFDYVGE